MAWRTYRNEPNYRNEPKVAVLSGPTFAREVAQGEPAAVVIASTDLDVASRVQAAFSGPTFRLYTNQDTIGVEVGPRSKRDCESGPVYAKVWAWEQYLSGVNHPWASGDHSPGCRHGRTTEDPGGLAGLGDLVLTCGGELSRNRKVGIELAKGRVWRRWWVRCP